jgi:hypothetical protein
LSAQVETKAEDASAAARGPRYEKEDGRVIAPACKRKEKGKMKNKTKRLISLTAAVTLIFVLAAGAGIGAQVDPPQGKKPEWAKIQAGLKNELEVCNEHCGGNKECLEKCDKAYKARLERERQRIRESVNQWSVISRRVGWVELCETHQR